MNQIIKAYFTAFTNKNLPALDALYHDDVVLWEWGQRVFLGKDKVLAANAELFSSAEHLVILFQSHAEAENKHYCEISIAMDDKMISVLDIITLQDDKIISVQAYRGF